MNAIIKRTLGRTGFEVSVLGFGAAPIGLLETEQQQIATILNELLDEGVNLIDTAASYAGSEEAIGKAVAHRRDEFVLVSKCGQEFDDLPGTKWSEQLILATVDRALERLQTDCLDVMLLHSCSLQTFERGEALGALVKAREAGKIRFAGYSGDNEAVAVAAAHPEVAVVETSLNITDQANIKGLLPVARKNNVGVIAKRPIANAAWKELSDQPGFYSDYAKTYHERFQAMGLTRENLGVNDDEDWASIALRYTLSQPGVHTAIIGTTNPDNAHRNLEAAQRGPLSPDTLLKFAEAFTRAEKESGEAWEAQT